MDLKPLDLKSYLDRYIEDAHGDPVIFVVPLPGSDSYRLADLRRACRAYGETYFKALGENGDITAIEVVIDRRVPAREPVLALNMIARDDAPGLARAIQSALEHVGEIVIGVDGRSDEATRQVAEFYADTVAVFTADDLQLSEAAWTADEIHFANARNASRVLVKAPWTLVIDADEIVCCTANLDRFLRHLDATEGDAVDGVLVPVGDFGQTISDCQRLARTGARYFSGMHNQLKLSGTEAAKLPDGAISVLHEGSLRSPEYSKLRAKQSARGIEMLIVEGKKGNMSALFHAAKHFLGEETDATDDRGIALVEDFRLRVEPHDPVHASARVYLAIYAAIFLARGGDLARAEMWAVRALLDGPNVDAFVLLGDLARAQKDLQRARGWYECACACEPDTTQFAIHAHAQRRFVERDDLRRTLMLLRTNVHAGVRESMERDHVVVTRFNIPVRVETTFRGLDLDWLAHRFALFERFTIPSMAAQTCRNFTWLILVDERTPSVWKERLAELLLVDGFADVARVLWCPPTREYRPVHAIASEWIVDHCQAPLLVTSRIDNDDAFAIDYVERVQAANAAPGSWVSFPVGCNFDVVGGVARRHSSVKNHFLTFVEERDESPPKTVMMVPHGLVKGPFVRLEGTGWLEVIHAQNICNQSKGEVVPDAAGVLAFFGAAL